MLLILHYLYSIQHFTFTDLPINLVSGSLTPMVRFGFMSFTRALGFASQSKDVIDTANRIVSRMKRDWMAIGRRPSGICGAAFVMAARLHGFKCNIEDITKVVKIGQNTIKKVFSIFECLKRFLKSYSASP